MGDLQTVPAVAANGTSASITLANITSGTAYNDPIAFSPAGLGLNAGSYYLVNAATGAAVPQTQQSNGLLCATANIGAATLAQWNVVAGAPPSGTASSSCPVTETGATSVTATAGQAGGGLQFLGVGQTNAGSDGNLTQITQGGETAVETWTSSQSGAGDANVYLQLNPLSAVEAAASVTVQVTYWATPGQGFTVQYDTPSNAYQNGPTVSSPGTGTWTTATVQLTGAQFDEAQNGGADLRLNVTNASAPLIVQSITMSVTEQLEPDAERVADLAVLRQPGGREQPAARRRSRSPTRAPRRRPCPASRRPAPSPDEQLRSVDRGGRLVHGQRDVHAHRGRRRHRHPDGDQQRRQQPADRRAVRHRHHLDARTSRWGPR